MNNIEMNLQRIEDMQKELQSRAQKQKVAVQEEGFPDASPEVINRALEEALQKKALRSEGESWDWLCWENIVATLEILRRCKPNNRDEKDRRYAIVITEMEKVAAYFSHWIVGQE